MRLILEKNEIVAVLSKHFDASLDPEKVIIRTDPFEIEVCGLPLADTSEVKADENVVSLNTARRAPAPTPDTPRTVEKERADPDATTEPPPPGKDGEDGEAPAIHPAAVLAASKALEQQLDRENPRLARRSGRWTEVAPTNHKDEL